MLGTLTLPVPRTAMAFRFFEPITAPMPPRPAARMSSRMMAYEVRFSPASPITATRIASSPTSWRIISCALKGFFPQRWEASRISTRSSSIQRYTGRSALPSTISPS
jgi:hypothetical protein